MTQVNRYHPLLVTLHWILAVIIVASLSLGALIMVHLPNNLPRKYDALRNHLIAGVLILVLMSPRFVVRQITALPPAAPTGSRFLDAIGFVSHRIFYILVLAQAATGLTMAVQANLFGVLFLHQGALPPDFWIYQARGLHYFFSRALMMLIALHLSGVAYHMVIRRDGLLRRMWFGRRFETSTTKAVSSGATSTR